MKKITLLLAICLAGLTASAQLQLDLHPFATGFSDPVDIANAGDDRLFVVEQGGRIRVVDARGNVNPTPFLDLSGVVSGDFEQGLLGLVFHPDYDVNGYFYVNYTNGAGDTRVSRFSRDALDPNLADPTSEQVLLAIPQPFTNHNGGDLNFGPNDGYLYVGLGDGGDGGDPGDRAQNPLNPLGKMLRLDVDGGSPYAIPPDNPFVGDPSARDEIWATGLRNPWRFSFDPLNGDLWIADVGQDEWEEINYQPAASAGGENYGWRCYEGLHSFNLTDCGPIGTYTFPIHEYMHSFFGSGGLSVTGGYVYRGDGSPGLYGKYIFCDWFSGNWWTLEPDGGGGWTVEMLTGSLPAQVSTFGVDAEGELYCARLDNGSINKLIERCNATTVITGLDAQVLGPNSANVYWDPIPGANGYRVQGRPVGAPSFQSILLVSNTVTVNVLSASTNYEWQVQARCTDGTITPLSDLETFSTPALREMALDLTVVRTPEGWRFDLTENGHWQLSDLAGRLLANGFAEAGTVRVDYPDDGTTGLYLLTVAGEDGVRRGRLLPSIR